MIRLVEDSKLRLRLTGNASDSIDMQDLVYRLYQVGYITDIGSNLELSNPNKTEFVYNFTDIKTVNQFKKQYKALRKKIMDEKKWRQNI